MNAKHRILGYCTGVANFRQQIWVLRSHKSSMSSRLSLKPRRASGRAKATFTPQFFTTYTQRLGTIQKTMRTVSVNFPEKLLASQLLHPPHCPNPQLLWVRGIWREFLVQDDSVVDRKFSLRIDARTTKSLKKWKSARAGWRMVHGQMAHFVSRFHLTDLSNSGAGVSASPTASSPTMNIDRVLTPRRLFTAMSLYLDPSVVMDSWGRTWVWSRELSTCTLCALGEGPVIGETECGSWYSYPLESKPLFVDDPIKRSIGDLLPFMNCDRGYSLAWSWVPAESTWHEHFRKCSYGYNSKCLLRHSICLKTNNDRSCGSSGALFSVAHIHD